jgi:hypothetical protein
MAQQPRLWQIGRRRRASFAKLSDLQSGQISIIGFLPDQPRTASILPPITVVARRDHFVSKRVFSRKGLAIILDMPREANPVTGSSG